MKLACLVYDILFQGLLKAVEQSSDDLFEGVQALKYKPKYNTLCNVVLKFAAQLAKCAEYGSLCSVLLNSEAWGRASAPALLCAEVKNVIWNINRRSPGSC